MGGVGIDARNAAAVQYVVCAVARRSGGGIAFVAGMVVRYIMRCAGQTYESLHWSDHDDDDDDDDDEDRRRQTTEAGPVVARSS
jgi:hypothetical protein